MKRWVSAFFTALPGSLLILLLLLTGFLGSEAWWDMFLAVLAALLVIGLVLGLWLPSLFQKMGLRASWLWILAQGGFAWGLALCLLGMLSLTPLCIGQENGDGVNNLFECMNRAGMSGLVCTPLYLGLLTISAFVGHKIIQRTR